MELRYYTLLMMKNVYIISDDVSWLQIPDFKVSGDAVKPKHDPPPCTLLAHRSLDKDSNDNQGSIESLSAYDRSCSNIQPSIAVFTVGIDAEHDDDDIDNQYTSCSTDIPQQVLELPPFVTSSQLDSSETKSGMFKKSALYTQNEQYLQLPPILKRASMESEKKDFVIEERGISRCTSRSSIVAVNMEEAPKLGWKVG